QIPDYRNVKKIILKKTKDLLRDISDEQKIELIKRGGKALFISRDARCTTGIKSSSVSLVITSPPFLDIVKYSDDNWLRCWFNEIDAKNIEKKITMSKTVENWSSVMGDVFKELYRIVKKGGWVAFEVGEVKNGKIKLEEHVIPLGSYAGFSIEAIMINEQIFTKTSNIWGIKNNSKGTNSNRIVLFRKE
ncbi:MAG: methylase N-4/N-6 domain protein, partial [Berkelbacteria bacterium GW2011_GWB1_38_5]